MYLLIKRMLDIVASISLIGSFINSIIDNICSN